MKRAFSAITKVLIRAEEAVLLICTALMLLTMLAAILARPMHFDVPWATPLVLALMIVSTFAGAALASATRRHIGMDLLTKVLPPRGRAVLGFLTASLGVVLTMFLATAGVRWAMTNREFNEPISLALKIPDWYLEFVVPVGFALCGVHFFINGILDLQSAISGDMPKSEAGTHGVPL